MKLLVGIGEGIGNFIMATPLVEALGRMGHFVDIICTPNYLESVDLLKGWNRIGKISTDFREFNFSSYDRILLTPWFSVPQVFQGMRNVIAIPTRELESKSEVEANMDLARTLGYEDETPPCHAEYSERRDFSMYADCVGFHNGANPGWDFKRWPYFPELAERFGKVVLVGNVCDVAPNESWPSNVYDFRGLLPLKDTAALVGACKTFVSNDSGMMHVASALGVKTYAVFGPTSQAKNLPNGVIPISKGLDCQPCQHTNRWGTCRDVRCLAELGCDEVWEKIQRER